jgi:acetyl-CoA carboxylase biotin carboxyl carrier protein
MKLKEIEELIDFIAKSGLEEVNIETDQIKLSIKKNLAITQYPSINKAATILAEGASLNNVTTPQPVPKLEVQPAVVSDLQNAEYITVKSPMIGTFYRSAKPEDSPFVQEGNTVAPGKTICIIEAMKLFNEIEAEVTGTIVKVLVEDASPVEYDQPLFLIKPA